MALVDPTQLTEYFELLIAAYERVDEGGRLLVEWFKSDWNMFSHPSMDLPRSKDLLADILADGNIVRQSFEPSRKFQSDSLSRWERLRSELMYQNRYFPSSEIDTERFQELLQQLTAELPRDDLPGPWYRARIKTGEDPFSIKDMGAPPNRLVSHGRANPPGIPYLYLNSTCVGAVSEVRPHTGEIACVAEYRIRKSVNVVDLRSPRNSVSPFLLLDEDQIGRMRVDTPFLERLGEELTIPVQPAGAAIDYVPSQYLCEFIKRCGYQGVLYRSSVSEGVNLALFDPSCARGSAVLQHRVSQVSVNISEPLTESAPLERKQRRKVQAANARPRRTRNSRPQQG